MKDFLVIGNLNAVTYKQVFPLIKAGQVRLGIHANTTMKFASPYENVQGDGNEIAVPAVTWYTTLHHGHVNPPLVLTKHYTPEKYPKYDNYDAIEVGRTEDIPMDYDGVMGVPISFLDKWNKEQFEVIWQACGSTRVLAPQDILQQIGYRQHSEDKGGVTVINGGRTFPRILIKRK